MTEKEQTGCVQRLTGDEGRVPATSRVPDIRDLGDRKAP